MKFQKKAEIVDAELFLKAEQTSLAIVEAVPYGGEAHSIMTTEGRQALPDNSVICAAPGRIFVMPRTKFLELYEPWSGAPVRARDDFREAYILAYAELAPDLVIDMDDPVQGMRAIIGSLMRVPDELQQDSPEGLDALPGEVAPSVPEPLHVGPRAAELAEKEASVAQQMADPLSAAGIRVPEPAPVAPPKPRRAPK